MVYGYGWRPYVPVAERRRRAARKVATLRKKGRTILPVAVNHLLVSAASARGRAV